jgi:hypothetical protein
MSIWELHFKTLHFIFLYWLMRLACLAKTNLMEYIPLCWQVITVFLLLILYKGLMTDEFINSKHEAYTSKRKHMLCLTENTPFFLNLWHKCTFLTNRKFFSEMLYNHTFTLYNSFCPNTIHSITLRNQPLRISWFILFMKLWCVTSLQKLY